MWSTTQRVGCFLQPRQARGGSWDYLVCNYSPPGNFVGQQPFQC